MAKLTVDAQGNYIVQPSDDLTKIATSAGLKLSDLISDPSNAQYRAPTTTGVTNIIQPGQAVHIPTLQSLGVNASASPMVSSSKSTQPVPGIGTSLTATPLPVPTYGSSVTAGYPQGQSGTAQFDPNTGLALKDPNTSSTSTSSSTTPTSATGTHTPQEVILAIMKDLQSQQQQGQAGLMAQQNAIQGTGFGLQNNVLQNTAMTPGAQTAAFNAAPGAVQNGVLSNNQQLQLGNQAFSNADDLLKTSLDTYKPVSLGYSGVYLPGSGQIVNQLSNGSGDAISRAIQLGHLTPDMLTRYGQTAIASVLSQDPDYNFISGQASKAGTIAAATTGSGYTMDAYGNFVQRAGGTIGGTSSSGSSNTGTVQTSSPSGYVVKNGDTYSAIASQLGTTVQALEQANPGVNENNLQIGQRINPPSSGTQSGGQSSGTNYSNFPKAVNATVTDQLKQKADVQRAITAADDNFALLTKSFSKSGINSWDAPVANKLDNAVKIGIFGNSDAINFKSAVSTLQTEYASVLGRGGEVTDSVRKSAQNVLNGNYSMNDLVNLHDYIKQEGANVINSYDKTIGSVTGQNSSTSSSGGNNPLGI